MAIVDKRYNCISDASEDSPNYLYSLLCDYEQYIKDFRDPISVNDFLCQWQCIPREAFSQLEASDVVYDASGNRCIILDDPYETEDEVNLCVTVLYKGTHGGECTMYTGDLYYSTYTHAYYAWRKKKVQREEEKLCPILITKTNLPQS